MSNQFPRGYRHPQGSTYRELHGVRVVQANNPRSMPVGAAVAQGRTTPAPGQEPQEGNYIEVPAWYTISVVIGGDPEQLNAVVAGSVALRPERFQCRRITYAAQADSPPYSLGAFGSPTANAVEIEFGDEFTQFMPRTPTLLGAVFGQANGFLDLPQSILFQGRQSLNCKLRRLQWTGTPDDFVDTRIDITFAGVGLLPVNSGGVSGSL